MTRTERLRRVLLVSSNCLRNVAFYRAGRRGSRPVLDDSFWRCVINNFLDVAVLEWCKLFGDRRDPHFWANVVADPKRFEAGLYSAICTTADDFDRYRTEVRAYRDKFIAHLDSEMVMRIPQLDLGVEAVSYYHAHIVGTEGRSQVVSGMPRDSRGFYDACRRVASDVYRRAQPAQGGDGVNVEL